MSRIHIESASFVPDNIERCGMGAGILPVAILPDGSLRVLLGRERFSPQWKGSCRWSGFEGSRKERERVEETALREFTEESMGIVPDDIPSMILNKEFWFRIVLNIVSDRRVERYHATYVVIINWDPDLPKKFEKRRLQVEHIDRTAQEWRHARPPSFGTHMVGPIRTTELQSTVWRTAMHSPCILCSPWVPDPDDNTLVKATMNDAEVSEWNSMRNRLERCLIDHPAVQVERDPHWGLLQDVTIVKDHLEKDQIRWWTPNELEEVLNGRGQTGSDRFRPYFLPVLQVFLNNIASPPLGRATGDRSPAEDSDEAPLPTERPLPRDR